MLAGRNRTEISIKTQIFHLETQFVYWYYYFEKLFVSAKPRLPSDFVIIFNVFLEPVEGVHACCIQWNCQQSLYNFSNNIFCICTCMCKGHMQYV